MTTTTNAKKASKKITKSNATTKTKNTFKDLTDFIIKNVFPNNSDLENAKSNSTKIMDEIYQHIILIGGGSISTIEQLTEIKVKIFDQQIYVNPDEGLNSKKRYKLGREKINSNDKDVSAKAEDRISCPNTLSTVFTLLGTALRKTTTNAKGLEIFGAGLKLNLTDTPFINPVDSKCESNLKFQIEEAKKESTSEWFKTLNEFIELGRPLSKHDVVIDALKNQDAQVISEVIKIIKAIDLTHLSKGEESQEETNRRTLSTKDKISNGAIRTSNTNEKIHSL